VRDRKGQHVLNMAIATEHRDQHRDPGKRVGNAPARRVIVVEDEALICVETADTLEQQGFEVHIALSGEDALRSLRGGLAVDILFTDINLGGALDGTMLARLARELLPTVVVVYTSGTVETVAQGVAGSAFVPKPYSPDRVGRLLSGMCAANVE
jgi:CheY-like chemotaxis protein